MVKIIKSRIEPISVCDIKNGLAVGGFVMSGKWKPIRIADIRVIMNKGMLLDR